MATITLRSTKGATLTHTEVDNNFTNLNDEKIQTSAAHAANDYAKFSTAANTVVGRSYSEVKTDLSLNNVENTALSTWAGSANITTLGTITTGTWQGSAISTTYISNLSGTNTGDEPAASTTVAGIVELASITETNAAVSNTRAITPAGLAGWTGNTSVITLGTITTGTWQGTAIADAYISSATTWNAKQNALTFGISDTNSVVINSASVADNDYAKFTATGLEGRSTSEVKSDLAITSADISDVDAFSQSGNYASLRAQATTKGDVGLGNVENTALSTWAGSSSITTLGTIATGTWNGSVIASAYLDSDTAHLSGAQTFSGAKTFNGGIVLTATGTQTPAITFNTSSGTDTGVDMAIRATGEGLDFYEPEDGNKIHMRIVDDTGVNGVFGLRTGSGDGTLRIDGSGNATLATCDANAFQEALTATTGGTYAVSCNTGVHWRTLNAACTISFTNTPASNTSRTITLIFQQDATGGRVITWPSTNWYWAENVEPPFDTTANAKNVVTVMVVNNGGTLHYYASLGIRNAS